MLNKLITYGNLYCYVPFVVLTIVPNTCNPIVGSIHPYNEPWWTILLEYQLTWVRIYHEAFVMCLRASILN